MVNNEKVKSRCNAYELEMGKKNSVSLCSYHPALSTRHKKVHKQSTLKSNSIVLRSITYLFQMLGVEVQDLLVKDITKDRLCDPSAVKKHNEEALVSLWQCAKIEDIQIRTML